MVLPASDWSASVAAHGVGATCPSTTRALATVLPFMCQGHRSGGQRPIERFLLTHFVGGVAPCPGGITISVRISLGSSAISRAVSFCGVTKNFSTATSRLPDGRNQLHLRAQRDQRRPQARRADEIRRSAAENRVIAILAIGDQALAVLHGEQAEALRKYQQRGRWQRSPPTVPMLRICGLVTPRAGFGSDG